MGLQLNKHVNTFQAIGYWSLDAGISLKSRNGTVRDNKIPNEMLMSFKAVAGFRKFWTVKTNSTKVINKHRNAIGYCSVLYLCVSHRFRKRKQIGNTLMIAAENPSTGPADKDAPVKSNLYLEQCKVGLPDTLLATWLQSVIGSANLKISQKFSMMKQSTSDGLQECRVVSSSRNTFQNIPATLNSMVIMYIASIRMYKLGTTNPYIVDWGFSLVSFGPGFSIHVCRST